MEKLKITLPFIFLIAWLTSCESKDTDFMTEECHDIKYETEISKTRGSNALHIQDDDGLKDVFAFGYSSVSNKPSVKRMADSEFAKRFGLTQGKVYVVRYEVYQKVVTLNGWDFFEDEYYDECGLRTSVDLNGEHISYDDRGYNSKLSADGKTVYMTTNLIHVLSDIGGANIDKYYPVAPADIKWHYILYKGI